MSNGIFVDCGVCGKIMKQPWADYYAGVVPVCSEECDIYGASEVDDEWD